MTDLVKNRYAIKFSLIAIIIITSHSLLFKDFWKSWRENETQFVWDVGGYYSYLPAYVIHEDLKFNYPNTVPLIQAPDGTKLQKFTCGMSIMYLPWFLLGHKIAINTHVPTDGYSGPYSDMVRYGTIFYSLLGFLFLRNVLLRYFRDGVVAITLLCLFFGTNLFYYTVGEGEMTHSYLFCLFSILLWLIIKWNERFRWLHAVLIGLVTGLITLIRPSEAIVVLVFLFYNVTSFQSLKDRMRLLLGKWPQLLVMTLCAIIALSPQLFYWKYITGHYVFSSYDAAGERFFWGDPRLADVLIGWRKGWLVYTPLMILALIGMFFGKKYLPQFNWAFKIHFIVMVYVLSSWWCWWYGGSFGMRAFIQSYSFLAFFLAAFIDKIFMTEWRPKLRLPQVGVRYLVVVALCFLVSLNLIQTYQYNKRILHFDGMTRDAYWISFCKFEHTGQDAVTYWASIRPPNYVEAQGGKRDQ